MIDKLIYFSIKNKLIIGLFTLALVGWGLYSLSRLPIDAVPDITNNQVQIITNSPTLAAQEVEQFITYPIEVSMANVPDVVEVRSISRFGLSVVTVVFEDEVDIYLARQLITERLREAEDQIPENMGRPTLAPISTGLGEIYQYVLHNSKNSPKQYSATELRTMQDWIVKRQLSGTPGVAEVSSFGGFLKQYEVAVNPEKLRGYNVTIPEIFESLEKSNENTGSAYIEKGHNAYFIRGIGLVTSLEDIEKIAVKNVNGIPLLIRDVAKVQYGHAVRYGAMTRNGEGEVVGGIVLMLKGENSAEVIERVKEKVKTIQKSLPEGVILEPFLDRSNLIERAINTVSKNLIEGGLIVIFILVLLLGNLRAGLVVASVIPLSMLFAVSMMKVFGISGNLMSLGAIDFGLVVDGAVIIVESIVFHISHNQKMLQKQRLTTEEMDEVVYDSASKIRKSAAFGEIIILIVYLPILTLVGIEGKMFKPMALTVGFAIIGALILSLTYVPMMSALFLSKKTTHKKNWADKIIETLERRYEPIIKYALSHKTMVVLISMVLFVFSLFAFSRLGGEFIPTLEEGDIATHQILKPGSTLTESIEASSKLQKILLDKFPEVKEVVTRIGSAEIPTDPMPVEAGDIIIVMKDKDEWTSASTKEEMFEKMEKELNNVPGIIYEFTQPIQMRFNELMTGVRADIAIKIFGEDLNTLAEKGKVVGDIVSGIPGAADVRVEQVKGLPQIVVTYKREKMAQYGLHIEEVNMVLRSAVAGSTAGVIFEGEKRFDMVVRLQEEFRHDIENIAGLFIPLPAGGQIPLREVAQIEFQEGPMQISREDAKRRITIGVNARDRDVESLVEEIQRKLEGKIDLPAGYYITYGGQFENLKAANQRLMVALPIALLLIFMLLYFTFGSIIESVLIFTAIPLSAIGGIFALILRDMPFSISAGVGFIALFGVAVLNGIVLIGYFNQLKKEGITDINQRVITGTKVRLRPVIMTAAVASLGFLPMALSKSAGAEVQKPLATVVIGGLITSTLLTLIVLPVLYSWVEKYLEKRKLHINGSGKVLSILFAILILSGTQRSFAQTQPQTLNLQDAIKIGLQNNPGIGAASLEVDQQKILRKTAYDFSQTNVGFEYGQINSAAIDNAFSLTQDFSLPNVYLQNANLARQQIIQSEFRLALSKAELQRNIKLAYFQVLYAQEKLKLYRYQDSLYSFFKNAADVSYQVGEGTYLEKTSAEARELEVKNQLFQAESDMRVYKTQLQRLLYISQDFKVVQDSSFFMLKMNVDTSKAENAPYLTFLKQQIAVNIAQTKVERSKLLPELSFGVRSQTIRGYQNTEGKEVFYGPGNRFNMIQGGIGIPLFFGSQNARIRASKIGEEIAQKNYQLNTIQVESELKRLTEEWLKYQNTLVYYQTSGIPQADLIIDFATKSYKLGEIGYFDYIQYLSQALQYKISYLENFNLYNQTIIQLEYLAGDQKQ